MSGFKKKRKNGGTRRLERGETIKFNHDGISETLSNFAKSGRNGYPRNTIHITSSPTQVGFSSSPSQKERKKEMPFISKLNNPGQNTESNQF